MTLIRKSDPIDRDGDVALLMWDDDHKVITLVVSREALEDYAASRGLKAVAPGEIFAAACGDIIKAAERFYERHPRPKPSRILLTSKDLNG